MQSQQFCELPDFSTMWSELNAATSTQGNVRCVNCNTELEDMSLENGEFVKICTRKIKEKYENQLIMYKIKQMRECHEDEISERHKRRSIQAEYELTILDCHSRIKNFQQTLDSTLRQLIECQNKNQTLEHQLSESKKEKNKIENELLQLRSESPLFRRNVKRERITRPTQTQ